MISFIGAGKVGLALGLYFKQKGLKSGGYYSRTYKHAEIAANKTDSKAFASIEALMERSTMVWITASDDALSLLADQIAQLDIPQQIEAFVHTSGVHSSQILQPIKDAGFSIYCAHPLMAFGEPADSSEQLKNTYFSLDTQIDDLRANDDTYLTRFFDKMGNSTLQIHADKKELYHCAATVLSNYMVTLLNLSYEMFAESGMSKAEIKKATEPLLKSTLKNIAENEEMSNALTGPIKRGDMTTIAKHLKALENHMPDKISLYKELGRETMTMIQDNRLKDILQ